MGCASESATNSAGAEQWTFSTDVDWDPFLGSPIVVDGAVYVGDYDGHLLDPETGTELNRFKPDAGVASAPAIANNTVYFGADDGQLHALAHDPNEAPEASFSYTPERPTVDATVTFDASESTDDVSIDEYRWDVDGDGKFEHRGQITPYAFESPGEYDVTLETIDGAGKSDRVTKSVPVASTKSVPTAAFTTTREDLVVDESVTFDASSAPDANGAIERYEWTLEGGTKQGKTVTLSAVNYLSEHPVTVQVALQTSNAVSVTNVAGAERSKDYTALPSRNSPRRATRRRDRGSKSPNREHTNWRSSPSTTSATPPRTRSGSRRQ